LQAGSAGTYAVKATATAGPYSASLTFGWEVAAAVTLADPGPQSSSEGEQVSVALDATTAAGVVEFAYAATGLPPGVAIAGGGVLTGMVAAGAGSYRVTVTATAAGGYSGTVAFDWLVSSPMTLTNPGDQGNLAGFPLQLQLRAANSNGGAVTIAASGL